MDVGMAASGYGVASSARAMNASNASLSNAPSSDAATEGLTGSTRRRTPRLTWLFVSLSRGLALFLALYSLLSLGATLLNTAYNQNAWWMDFSFLPSAVSGLEQLALTLSLGFFAFHLPQRIGVRLLVAVPVFVGLFTAVINTVYVYTAAGEGTIILGFPLPFSFFVGLGMLCILLSVLLGATYLPAAQRPGKPWTAVVMAAGLLCTGLLFPVGQMHCFGTTDYRVPVDAAVVLGAQVYPNGTPSPVLQDRLDTAIRFYKDGYAPLLVMSGGIDADGTSEAQVMRDYAIANGVDPEDIIIDEQGSNTKQTAKNTVATLQAAGLTKVATVSNFYHLARIKMLYLAEGMDVVTVPSVPDKDPRYPLINVVREIPGWWYYWLLNLVE
ncbi:MAG: YdcF family protein [Coriobacteriales bacterium]|jgi:uncharacterized SAM-binding protein YcdF (DUF218 family)|nr:YdcF family protein [Coriobacteriales bacterium]